MSTRDGFSLTDQVRLAAAPSLTDEVKRASRVRRRPLVALSPALRQGTERSVACEVEPVVVTIGGLAPAKRRPLPSTAKPRVFLAHGHDHAARLEVTRFIERAGFEAIVLNEQAHQGLTILEKIEACPGIDFAIILMTPDDECVATAGSNTRRARQNVIWEHGYFAAKLGRAKTCVLIKGDVEIPSDIKGKMWIDFDARGAWRLEVAKEMRASSLPFEADALL